MKEILKNILNRELQDFKGSRIEGQLSLSDKLVNEVLQLGIKEMIGRTNEVAMPPTSKEESSSIDVQALLQFVQVNKLHYRTESGKTIIELSAEMK